MAAPLDEDYSVFIGGAVQVARIQIEPADRVALGSGVSQP